MGCDIHMYAEVRENGKWVKVGKVFDYEYYNPTQPTRWSCYDENGSSVEHGDAHTAECWEHNQQFTDQPYTGRNYSLFSILADCGRGSFAPIVDGNRGVPADASDEYKEIVKHWASDGHSHSWYTLDELLKYDWKRTEARISGVVTEQQYLQRLATGELYDSWCGFVGGKNVVTYTRAEYEDAREKARRQRGSSTSVTDPLDSLSALVEDLRKQGAGDEAQQVLQVAYAHDYKMVYVQDTWTVTASEHALYFTTRPFERLKKLGDPKDVRVVFFFDN